MKCPLIKVDDHERSGYPVPIAPECLKEECAWWSKSFELCDINILCQELYELRETLRDMRDKMPERR